MNFKPFSAFGTPAAKLTVADIIAPIQTAVEKLNTVISQRSESIITAKQQVSTLEQQIDADNVEINSAKAVQDKLKNLLL